MNRSTLLILLEFCRLTSSPFLVLIKLLTSSLKYPLWCNLIMILSVSFIVATFITHGYSWSALVEEFFLSMSNILQFSMAIAFTFTSLLTSGSSSFVSCNSALIFTSDSGFQGKAESWNQRVTLLTFVPSKPLEPISAGLSCDKMYFHCSVFEFSFIFWTLLAAKVLKHFTSLLM